MYNRFNIQYFNNNNNNNNNDDNDFKNDFYEHDTKINNILNTQNTQIKNVTITDIDQNHKLYINPIIKSENSDDYYNKNITFNNNKKMPFKNYKNKYTKHPNNKIIKQNNNNKKILCRNIILNNVCPYGNKCIFAHTKNEQIINNLREQSLHIITSNNDISDVNLKLNYKLYEDLLSF